MWYIVALAACVAGDQLLKWWVVSHLEVGQSAPLLPGVMQLTRLHNTGAAWSSFSGKTGLLAIVTIVLMLAVAWLLVKRIVRHPLGVTAGVLILGGGIGNVIDRMCRGYVVDMFDLQFIDYPIFNLADCFVVIGVVMRRLMRPFPSLKGWMQRKSWMKTGIAMSESISSSLLHHSTISPSSLIT